jgi:hypothetical protein
MFRGSDKIYLAILLVCIIIVSSFNGPFSSIFRPESDTVDQYIHESTSNDNPLDFADADVDDVETEFSNLQESHASLYPGEWIQPPPPELDELRLQSTGLYIRAIMDPADKTFARLRCPRPIKERYEMLRRRRNFATRWDTPPRRWFFALNLYECSHVLPRLLASVVEAIRFLRPEDCVLSIVGGRSGDGTTEVLAVLRKEMEAMNVTYYFSTSDIDPLQSGHDRITELAQLRNLVMDPLVRQPELYDRDTTVIFLNDVSICTDDILEMIYQKASVWLPAGQPEQCLLIFPGISKGRYDLRHGLD